MVGLWQESVASTCRLGATFGDLASLSCSFFYLLSFFAPFRSAFFVASLATNRPLPAVNNPLVVDHILMNYLGLCYHNIHVCKSDKEVVETRNLERGQEPCATLGCVVLESEATKKHTTQPKDKNRMRRNQIGFAPWNQHPHLTHTPILRLLLFTYLL